MVPEGNFKEFQELTDEGLVSSARERFSTGNILGSQSGRRRSSVETNYIDKNHIDSLTSKFEDSASGRWWCRWLSINIEGFHARKESVAGSYERKEEPSLLLKFLTRHYCRQG